jgi:hypothetical protein
MKMIVNKKDRLRGEANLSLSLSLSLSLGTSVSRPLNGISVSCLLTQGKSVPRPVSGTGSIHYLLTQEKTFLVQ